MTPTPAARRLPSLDGLRGLALLAVLAHQFERVEAPADLAARLIATVLDRGWIGVQLFFVLSGFLITGLLMDGGRTPAALGRFFARRALRILPMYGLLLAALLWLPAAVTARCGPAPQPVWPYWLLLSNWTAPFETAGNGCMVHLWSLAVEEQFYLLWPLLAAGRGPRSVLALSALTLAVACVARPLLLATGVPAEAVYTWTPTRLDALAAGAAVAAWWRLAPPRRPAFGPEALAIAGALALAAGWFVADGYARTSPAGQTLGYPLLALACAALLAAAVLADARADDAPGRPRALQAVLTPAWLRVIGRHSYAMYLLHRPFDLLLGRPALEALGLAGATSLTVSVAYTAVATIAVFGLSRLAWRWVEAPSLSLAPASGAPARP